MHYISRSSSLNILQIVPAVSDSHVMFNYKFAKMLQNAGHNVTLLKLIMSIGKIGLSDFTPPENIQQFQFAASPDENELEDTANVLQDTIFKVSIIKFNFSN